MRNVCAAQLVRMKFLAVSVAALFFVLMFVCCIFYCSSDTNTVWSGWRHARMLHVNTASSVIINSPIMRDSASPPTAWEYYNIDLISEEDSHTPRREELSPSTVSHFDDSSFFFNVSLSSSGDNPTTSRTNTVTPSSSTITKPTTTTRTESTRTYMITRTFGGQLTRAVRNMMMQQCWARSLSNTLTLLEPFSYESQLLHTPGIWTAVRKKQTKKVARFSDFFDLKQYNRASIKSDGIPLVTWEEFLLRAPRQVIVIVTPQASCSLIVNHNLQTSADKYLKEFLRTLQLLNFNIVKIIPINCYDQNRGSKLVEMLSMYLHNSTLVFSSWRNYNVAKTWLDIHQHCDISDKFPADRLHPSSKMIRHTDNYRSKILGGANKTIAIMLRVERFLTLKSSNETVDSCLAKTIGVFTELKKQPQWQSSQPFLTLDIGRYGSGIMQNNDSVLKFNESLELVTQSVTDMLVNVYEGKWKTLEDWEDSFLQATEGISERGYVAMLQRDIAVQSDCLILMGGGSFQEIAATQYLKVHPDPTQQCLHIVCSATSLTISLDDKATHHKHKRPRIVSKSIIEKRRQRRHQNALTL